MKEKTSPSAILAVLVVERLNELGLIRKERCDHLVAKVATGKMTGDDWRLEIDLASKKAGQS